MRILSYIVVILTAVLMACARDIDAERLSRAEAVMESCPDSALAILVSIDTNALSSESSRAKYALLLTQAEVKNNIFPPNDSLINRAAAYYAGRGDYDDMKARFYQGNVRFYNNEYSSAILPAMQARELAIGLNDDYWRAKSAEMIADIYGFTYYDDSEFRNEAIDYYLKAGRVDNHRYAICDRAIGCGNMGNIDSAVFLLDSIAAIAKSSNPIDSGLLAYGCRALFSFYLKQEDYVNADSVYSELVKLGDYYTLGLKDYTYMADLELYRGHPDKCLDILTQLRPLVSNNSELASVYVEFVVYYKKLGLDKEARIYTDSILSLQNTETRRTLAQSVVSKQRDYLESVAGIEKAKADRRFAIIIICVAFFVVVIAAIVAYSVVSLRNKKLVIENKMNEILLLTKTIEQQKSDMDFIDKKVAESSEQKREMAERLRSLFRDKWATINMICNQYFVNEISDKDSKTIVRDLNVEINKLRSAQNMEEIENAVNLYMDNIVSRLKEQCPFLKRDEISFMALNYAGLSARAVCIFTGIGLKYFYVKRKRILDKIKCSDATSKDEFVSMIK